MRESITKGMGFGVTSAIITTLGIIVGIHSGTDLKYAVIASILVIAFADSLADSFGIYLSEKSRDGSAGKEAWISMLSAFLSKFVFALSFVIPIICFKSLHSGIVFDLIYGMVLLGFISFRIAKSKHENVLKTIIFHIILAIVVIVASHLLGNLVEEFFKDK